MISPRTPKSPSTPSNAVALLASSVGAEHGASARLGRSKQLERRKQCSRPFARRCARAPMRARGTVGRGRLDRGFLVVVLRLDLRGEPGRPRRRRSAARSGALPSSRRAWTAPRSGERRASRRRNRALTLRNPCVIQPSEIDARCSLVFVLVRGAGKLDEIQNRRRPSRRSARAAASATTTNCPINAPERRSAGQSSREAAAAIAGHAAEPGRQRPAGTARQRGRARGPSGTPSEPEGTAACARGRAGGGSSAASPRSRAADTSAIAASPNSCISRSATIAPPRPSTLRTGALVAWLRLGSCTDQVASASASRTASPDQREADSSRSRRCSASRSASGRKSGSAMPRSMAGMVVLNPAPRPGGAALRPWSARSCTMATRM